LLFINEEQKPPKKDGRNEIAKPVERMTRSVNCGIIALWLKP